MGPNPRPFVPNSRVQDRLLRHGFDEFGDVTKRVKVEVLEFDGKKSYVVVRSLHG